MYFPSIQKFINNIKKCKYKVDIIDNLKSIGDLLRGHAWENETVSLSYITEQLVKLFIESKDSDIKEEVIYNLIQVNIFNDIDDIYKLYNPILESLDKLNYLELNEINLNELYYSIELISSISIKDVLEKYENPIRKLLNSKFSEEARDALDELVHIRKLESLDNFSIEELNSIVINEQNNSFAILKKAKELLIKRKK